MQLHHLEARDAFVALRSSPDGLRPEDAEKRLRELGPNEVEKPKRDPLIKRLGRELFHFFALILWAAAALAFIAAHYQRDAGMGMLGFAILGVIVINGAFSFWQEHKAEQAIEALQELLPRVVRVKRAGQVNPIPAREIVPGDVILISAGDEVPADAMLLERSRWPRSAWRSASPSFDISPPWRCSAKRPSSAPTRPARSR